MTLTFVQIINSILLMSEAIFCIVAAICFFWGKKYEPRTRKWMIRMQLSASLLLFGDVCANLFRGMPGETGYWMVRISNLWVFFTLEMTLLFFVQYVNNVLFSVEECRRMKRTRLAEANCILGMALVVLSQFTGLYYCFDAENIYHRAAGYPISMAIPMLTMLIEASLLLQYRNRISKYLFRANISYIILPMVGAVIQILFYGVALIEQMTGVSMILMFLAAIREQNMRLSQLEASQMRIAEKLEIATMLNRCVAKLSDGADRNVALNNLMEIVRDYFQADRSYLFEIEPTRNILVNTYEAVKSGVVPQINNLQEVPVEVIAHWMEKFRQERVYYMDSLEQEKGFESYEMLQVQDVWRLLAVPLCRNGQIIGFLGLDNPRRHAQDATLLSSIQFFITNSLERRDQQEYLQKLSYYDLLTHLRNRNGYIESLNLWKQTKLEQVGCVFIDLNGLKKINDEQGHGSGDQLICQMAEILKAIFPERGYRIGGDEFVVIQHGIPQDAFCAKVQQFREKLLQQKVSAAVGAVWEQYPKDLETMLHQADERMYSEKEKMKQT